MVELLSKFYSNEQWRLVLIIVSAIIFWKWVLTYDPWHGSKEKHHLKKTK